MNLGLTLEEVRGAVLRLLGHEIPAEGVSKNRAWPKAAQPSTASERIRSLENQLWNLRVLLGAVAGAVASSLLSSDMGVVIAGLVLGGFLAGVGGRILGALVGGITGLLLGCAHLSSNGGGLVGALLGALAGVLLAEMGGPPDGPGFFRSRQKT